jgi:hypothetical protein
VERSRIAQRFQSEADACDRLREEMQGPDSSTLRPVYAAFNRQKTRFTPRPGRSSARRTGDSLYGQYFNGLIDEVRIFNVARRQAQIQTDMKTAMTP